MTSNDIAFFNYCHEKGWILDNLLDIGSSTFDGAQDSFSVLARNLGVKEVTGCDLSAGSGVDLVYDFSVSDTEFEKTWTGKHFNTVLIFNVLEHTFNPYQVLRNASRCLKPGGFLLVVVPAIWPIHSFPKDHCRLLPDWFEEFSKRENLKLMKDGFLWLSQFNMQPVDKLTEGGERVFPSFQNLGKATHPLRYWSSRISHKLLNTFGRNHIFTHAALAAVMQKSH
jgi:SAM-dependent methyltransferase